MLMSRGGSKGLFLNFGDIYKVLFLDLLHLISPHGMAIVNLISSLYGLKFLQSTGISASNSSPVLELALCCVSSYTAAFFRRAIYQCSSNSEELDLGACL